MTDLIERFFAFVEHSESGCHLWTGSIKKNGYGQFSLNQRPIYAHRFAYLIANGKIPSELQIDHLCRVKNCVNPEHLEAVTASVNMCRAKGAA